MPAPISGTQYIAVASNDQTLVGQHYNRSTSEFEVVYYYAVLNENGIVTSVTYHTTQQTTSDTLISITFAQYQTVVGMYWNGTEFTEPPISSLALASTDEINYKGEEKWLSTKLDEMEEDIEANKADKHTHSNKTVLDSITAEKVAAWDSGTGGSGTAGADGEDGVTFTPSVSADGVLSWTNDGGLENPTPVNIKGADGTNGTNGTDGEDGADGVSPTVSISKSGTVTTITITDATGTHTATINDGTNGTDGAEITAAQVLEKLLTVDGTGSGIDADKLDGMDSSAFAEADHTHDDYITATTYAAGMSNKSNMGHTHSISDVSGLQSELNGKSNTGHTHSDYLPTSGGTVSGNLNVGGILRVNSQQSIFDSGSMITLSTNNRETMIAGSKIYSKTTISVSSDERLKENINEAPTDDLAKLVESLDVKTFKYIGKDEENVGIIAQELIKKNPNLEKYFIRTDENGYYSVKTSDLVFPLIAAVQKLKKEIDELKK